MTYTREQVERAVKRAYGQGTQDGATGDYDPDACVTRVLAALGDGASLPVLASCRPCRHWMTVEGGAREVCFHPDGRRLDGTRIYAYLGGEPSEECPLRAKESR